MQLVSGSAAPSGDGLGSLQGVAQDLHALPGCASGRGSVVADVATMRYEADLASPPSCIVVELWAAAVM